uniref:PDZ domain-containing protein n=1 Tax=Guillardia theta TaxID=55529 RepID=A0A7S4P4U1_GUITH|mmetsp:Transcript_43084/g.136106  ORF Transcript_43084/g.136106 Transcript_43084/m.136106 type:complete len:369 (+) Transcript_43084:199-1305(+)
MSGRGTGQKRTRSSVTLGGRFTDNLLGIVWKECRRSVYQSSQFDDGRRKLLVVERILPASPAASSSALRPGDKLVSLTMDGMHRDTIGEGIASYSEFLLTLEEVREARIEMLGVSTLFNFKASNSHKGSRNTFSVLLSLKQPGSKGVRSQHAHHGRQSMSRGGSRPSTQSSSSSLTPRPQTSSWRVSEDARDPRSTRPLNAQRFERLVFMVNRHLKDPAVLQLLSQSYEVDRPPSSLSPSQSLAGPIALSLRPCYRLNRWWNQEEVLKMKFCLAAMKKHSDSVKLMDVLEILESHISESENYQDVLGEWMEEACCLLQASIRRLRTRRLVQGEEHGRPSTADEDVRNTLMMMEKSSNLLVDSVLEVKI